MQSEVHCRDHKSTLHVRVLRHVSQVCAILSFQDQFLCYHAVYVEVFQEVSFPNISLPAPSAFLISLIHVPHAAADYSLIDHPNIT